MHSVDGHHVLHFGGDVVDRWQHGPLVDAAGVPQSAVMAMTAHGSVAVHQVYVSVDDETKRKGINSLPTVKEGA